VRHPLNGHLWVALLLVAAACVTPSGPDVQPLDAQVLAADSRALAYGRTVDEVIKHPDVRDKLPALFGADWTPAAGGRGQLATGAAAFFAKGGALRMVRVAGTDYIAVTGCAADACPTQRVLLLIREGASQLLARIDDGPISHYYAFSYGSQSVPATATPAIVDAGLRALRSAGSPYPS